MPYASQSDIVTLYGANALVVADHDRDGVPDTEAVTRALDLASAEIDTYIGRRYNLPLPVASTPHLMQLCVDIALYRLALSQDVASTEHRTRYEDAITTLVRIADGRAALVLPAQPPAEGEEGPSPEVSGPQPIVAGGPPRLFSREQMRDL
ncbi:gp436 family protein [Gemmobacter serpentinus]|uniref:gp436 family protein n=1 Tax=Gemmobacter serpentinus TaxID=2652247 RepID=UPI00124CA034|nr:DUF1320 domain-containing protein [Gemmobacter serpentinus]